MWSIGLTDTADGGKFRPHLIHPCVDAVKDVRVRRVLHEAFCGQRPNIQLCQRTVHLCFPTHLHILSKLESKQDLADGMRNIALCSEIFS